MDKIRIRRMQKEDADQIIKIEAAITKAADGMDLKQIIEEQVQKKSDASFVAESEGRIVGYMISYTTSGNFGIDKSAWISVMGVDPKYMGQGIGVKLAETIFSHYKKLGITDVFTSVRWDFTDLLSFFKTLGFDRSNFIHLRKVIS